jgi:hypothetical protein
MDAEVAGDDEPSRPAADGGGLRCRDARLGIGEYGNNLQQGERGGSAEE